MTEWAGIFAVIALVTFLGRLLARALADVHNERDEMIRKVRRMLGDSEPR